jgi:hypothetical protein
MYSYVSYDYAKRLNQIGGSNMTDIYMDRKTDQRYTRTLCLVFLNSEAYQRVILFFAGGIDNALSKLIMETPF